MSDLPTDEDERLGGDERARRAPERGRGGTYVHRRWLSQAPLFDRRSLREDLLGGLTVALVGLPQCLAYAMMSGLPPAYGLATAAVPGAIAALAGKSAQVITGPTNTTSLLILAAIAPWIGSGGLLTREGLPVLATLTLLAGLVRIVGAVAGATELLRFLPMSVLVGFTAGAGILIAMMQLDEALGLPPAGGGSVIDELRAVAVAIDAGHVPGVPAVLTTVVTALSIRVGQRFVPRVPMALVVMFAAVVIAWAFDLDASDGLPLVSDRSGVPSGWPHVALPRFDLALLRELAVPALAITFLGTLELAATARASGERPAMKRELLAQGLANIGGAFTASFPASASLTRSALLKLGGARSRLAALTAAIAVVPVLLFGGELVGHIPLASLAGILLVTALGMVDRARITALWVAGREPRLLVIVTLVATLTLPLEIAILLGAGLSLAIHLARTSRPRLVVLAVEGGALRPPRSGEEPELVVIEVSGDLHYAATSGFERAVLALVPKSAKRVILDLSHAHEARYSAMNVIEELARELHERGVVLELAGVEPALARLFAHSGSDIRMTGMDAAPGAAVRRAIGGEGRPAES